jgi:hypothetical protein
MSYLLSFAALFKMVGGGGRREVRGKERKGTGRKGMERGRDRRKEGERDGGRESLIPGSYC